MPHASKEEVQSILDEYHVRIRSVVERAWADYRTVAKLKAEAGISPPLYSRTAANDIFDGMATYAIIEFGNDPLVKLKVEAQTIKLTFKGKLIARFKKGDGNRLGRNIATQAALAFADPAGELPGMPHAAKVEFIWIANELQTKLEHVLVVARDGDRLVWDYEIEPVGIAEVVPLPAVASIDDDLDEELVKPKVAPAQKKKTE